MRKTYVVGLPPGPAMLAHPGAGVGHELVLGERPLVMGILNVTPDSFADGGRHMDPGRAVDAGLRMVEEGADILDVGGESTRPGALPVPADEELRRVLPVLEGLAARAACVLSIDTYKAVVAREAIARGAAIVNDISGLQYEPELGAVVAEAGAALVLMHTRGRPRDMARHARYGDVIGDVVAELREAMARAAAAGVPRDAILVDPGVGFAKEAPQSLQLLAQLDRLAALDRPVLVGPSRKSFLQRILGPVPPDGRDWGTAAVVAASVMFGAHVVRVHAVKEMAQVVRVAEAIRQARQSQGLTESAL